MHHVGTAGRSREPETRQLTVIRVAAIVPVTSTGVGVPSRFHTLNVKRPLYDLPSGGYRNFLIQGEGVGGRSQRSAWIEEPANVMESDAPHARLLPYSYAHVAARRGQKRTFKLRAVACHVSKVSLKVD